MKAKQDSAYQWNQERSVFDGEPCPSVCYDFSDIGCFRQGTVLAVPSPRYDSRGFSR